MNNHYFYEMYRRLRRGLSIIGMLTLLLCLFIFVNNYLETKKPKHMEVATSVTPMVDNSDTAYKRNVIGFDITEKKEPAPVEEKTDMGWFKISAYCPCVQCCGKTDGITATGTQVSANRTIAVDPNVIPLGSKVVIDGHTYIAEDTGGAIKGNRIDMYFPTHQEALNFGVQYKNIEILKY